MEHAKIARLALVKQRLRDASRARLLDAERELEASQHASRMAAEAFEKAHRALGATGTVEVGDLELRARAVVERQVEVRRAETVVHERRHVVEVHRAARIAAEREVHMMEHAEERAASAERREKDKREDAERDDRTASRRRSA